MHRVRNEAAMVERNLEFPGCSWNVERYVKQGSIGGQGLASDNQVSWTKTRVSTLKVWWRKALDSEICDMSTRVFGMIRWDSLACDIRSTWPRCEDGHLIWIASSDQDGAIEQQQRH